MANEQNLIPAKKGEVRNPKGKPKGTLHLSTHIQNALNDPDFKAEFVEKDGTKIEFKGLPIKAIIQTAVIKAKKGDKQWADWLAQNGYGTKQTVDMTMNENPVEQIIQATGLRKEIEGIREENRKAHDTKGDADIPIASENQT